MNGKMITRKDVKTARRLVAGRIPTGALKKEAHRRARHHARQAIAKGDLDFDPIYLDGWDIA